MHKLSGDLDNGDITEAARNAIDKDIEGHLKAIQSLRTRRNHLAPISRLPAEIISHIFFQLKPNFYSDEYYMGHRIKEWIRFSHICSRWREIALNSPSLWAEIPLGNALWLDEALKRSKMAGLSITVEPYNKATATRLKETLRVHGFRIHHLTIDNIMLSQQDILDALPISVPQLKTLRLNAAQQGYSQQLIIPNGALTNTGHLREVELSRIGIQLHAYDLHRVVNLKLHYVPMNARATWAQTLDAFRTMSQLETLDIKSAFAPEDHSSKATLGVAHFPRLQKLLVVSDLDELQTFFRFVTFPSTAQANVCAQNDGMTETHNSQRLVALSGIAGVYSQSPPDRQFRVMHLEGYRGQEVSITLFMGAEKTETLKIRIQGNISSDDVFSSFFQSTFPLDEVESVRISEGFACTAKAMQKTIGMLPALSSIKTIAFDLGRLIDTLVPPNENESLPLYFPSLKSIDLNVSLFDPHFNIAGELQNCLIQRYEHGVEIEKLVLKNCHALYDEDVDEFKQIVVDVDWDGIEVDTNGDEDEDEDEDEEDYGGVYFDYYGLDYEDSDMSDDFDDIHPW